MTIYILTISFSNLYLLILASPPPLLFLLPMNVLVIMLGKIGQAFVIVMAAKEFESLDPFFKDV